MGNRYRELSRSLEDFSVTLQTESPGEGRESTDNHNPPQVEMIDFDRMREIMRKSAEELNSIQAILQEREVVRQWFISRISSLIHGYRAILSGRGKRFDKEALEQATIPDLMHRFEEESARLRSTASHGRIISGKGACDSIDDLLQFKS